MTGAPIQTSGPADGGSLRPSDQSTPYRLVGYGGRQALYSSASDRLYPLAPEIAQTLARFVSDPELLNQVELSCSDTGSLPEQCYDPDSLRREVETAVSDRLQQLVLGVTENCNLACRYCVYGNYSGIRSRSTRRMSWDIARRAIDHLVAHRGSSGMPAGISFYGGEPLLQMPLIRRCIEYSGSVCGDMRFVITTNGTLLDRNTRGFLAEHRVHLLVSLDGPGPIQDRYRRRINGAPTFDLITRNLEALKAEFPDYYDAEVGFSVVLAPPIDYAVLRTFFDRLDLPTVVAPMERYGAAPEWRDRKASLDFQVLAEDFKIAARQASIGDGSRSWRRFAVALVGPAMRRIQSRSERPSHTFFRLGQCIPGARKLFVSPSGDLYPCEKVEGNEEVRIGHIETGVDPDAVQHLIERFIAIVSDNCTSCWMRRMCSACLADVVQGGRSEPAKLATRCEPRRENHERLLGLYSSILTEEPTALDFLPEAYPYG